MSYTQKVTMIFAVWAGVLLASAIALMVTTPDSEQVECTRPQNTSAYVTPYDGRGTAEVAYYVWRF